MNEYEKPKFGNIDFDHPIETTYYDVINYNSKRNMPEEEVDCHVYEEDSTHWYNLMNERDELERFEEDE